MTNSLKHIGVLGMHWGQRKGPDNSSSDHKVASSLKKKKLSDMSNSELKTLTTRLQLERSYKDLSKSNISLGKKFIDNLIQTQGEQLVSKYVASAVQFGANKLIEVIKKK